MEFNIEQLQELIAAKNYSVSECDQKLIVPIEFIKSILASGFVSPFIRSELDLKDIGDVMTSIGYYSEDNGANFALGAHCLSALTIMNQFMTEKQKSDYLIPCIKEQHIVANAMTESESGSDAFNMTTTAKKETDGYLLNGTKSFVSNCQEAEWFIVYAMSDETKGALGGVSVFLIHKSELNIESLHVKMGLRTCSSGEIKLQNTRIPADRLIGKEGAGLTIFNSAMMYERYGLSSMHVGTMNRLMQACIKFCRSRKTSGGAIINNQVIAHRLAEMKLLLLSSEAIIEKVHNSKASGTEILGLSSACKLLVSENYLKFCNKLMSIYAGQAYTNKLSIERMHRDAQASIIYSGTSDIQKNLIATFLM